MVNSPMAASTFMALGLAAALLSTAGPTVAQNCGCEEGYCCSQYGYCGTTPDYCGHGCQSGPCTASSGAPSGQNCNCQEGYCCSQYGYCGTTADYCAAGCRSGSCWSGGAPSGSVSVDSIVTDGFFYGIKSQSDWGCPGQSFYTRQSFLDAAGAYPGFATGSDAKREIAAFFAHVTHETGHMCYIEEINRASDYCDPSNTQWPCYPWEKYYGRGPIQISWNYNYGPAGQSIGFDGLRNPQVVSQDPVIAFKTALWFWMNNVHWVMPQGFGATIRAINGALECNGNNWGAMNARVGYYQDYCGQLGVDAGGNLYC